MMAQIQFQKRLQNELQQQRNSFGNVTNEQQRQQQLLQPTIYNSKTQDERQIFLSQTQSQMKFPHNQKPQRQITRNASFKLEPQINLANQSNTFQATRKAQNLNQKNNLLGFQTFNRKILSQPTTQFQGIKSTTHQQGYHQNQQGNFGNHAIHQSRVLAFNSNARQNNGNIKCNEEEEEEKKSEIPKSNKNNTNNQFRGQLTNNFMNSKGFQQKRNNPKALELFKKPQLKNSKNQILVNPRMRKYNQPNSKEKIEQKEKTIDIQNEQEQYPFDFSNNEPSIQEMIDSNDFLNEQNIQCSQENLEKNSKEEKNQRYPPEESEIYEDIVLLGGIQTDNTESQEEEEEKKQDSQFQLKDENTIMQNNNYSIEQKVFDENTHTSRCLSRDFNSSFITNNRTLNVDSVQNLLQTTSTRNDRTINNDISIMSQSQQLLNKDSSLLRSRYSNRSLNKSTISKNNQFNNSNICPKYKQRPSKQNSNNKNKTVIFNVAPSTVFCRICNKDIIESQYLDHCIEFGENDNPKQQINDHFLNYIYRQQEQYKQLQEKYQQQRQGFQRPGSQQQRGQLQQVPVLQRSHTQQISLHNSFLQEQQVLQRIKFNRQQKQLTEQEKRRELREQQEQIKQDYLLKSYEQQQQIKQQRLEWQQLEKQQIQQKHLERRLDEQQRRQLRLEQEEKLYEQKQQQQVEKLSREDQRLQQRYYNQQQAQIMLIKKRQEEQEKRERERQEKERRERREELNQSIIKQQRITYQRRQIRSATQSSFFPAGRQNQQSQPHRFLKKVIPPFTEAVYVSSDTTENCCICQSEFEEGEQLGILSCKHKFHKECIQQWIKFKRVCPLDKRPI